MLLRWVNPQQTTLGTFSASLAAPNCPMLTGSMDRPHSPRECDPTSGGSIASSLTPPLAV